MKKVNLFCKAAKKTLISALCIGSAIIVIGSAAACVMKDGSVSPPQESAIPGEAQRETAPASDIQREPAKQDAGQPQQSSNEKISLEDAKKAALTDAGLSDADVTYTKEKIEYEDGLAVYDIEFYVDNVEYAYEIDAATGAVYSKSMETHHGQQKEDDSQMYIGVDSATSIALKHAGFSDADVSRLKSKLDMEDGQAVYEVEFYRNGREYEYKISAMDGSVLEYEVD